MPVSYFPFYSLQSNLWHQCLSLFQVQTKTKAVAWRKRTGSSQEQGNEWNEPVSTSKANIQTLQIPQFHRESPGFEKFIPASQVIKFFPQYCLPPTSKRYWIWKLCHPFSTDYFLTYYIFPTAKNARNWKKLNWTALYRIQKLLP